MAIRESDLQRLRATLIQRRTDLLSTLNQDLTRLAVQEDYIVGDSGDGSIEDEYQCITARLSHSESRELAMVDHALRRVVAGEYGICEECGGPIAAARLRAIPFAATCIRCQQEAERQLPRLR